MKKFTNILMLAAICILAFLLILKPQICAEGVASAIILCGRVLIPSLFPFSVCVLYMINSGITERLRLITPITKRIFGLNHLEFVIFLLSLIGGYPIGAKLINEEVKKGCITPERGGIILNFCINAGPGFIVSAVGSSILGNENLGWLLLTAHLASSLTICALTPLKKGFALAENHSASTLSAADNFVSSAASGATAVTGICGFVILFSAITAYLEHFSENLRFLKSLIYLCEVTIGISKTQNIYLISFLLGFSGLCIWCQISGVGKSIKINTPAFVFNRIIHGVLSTVYTGLLLKIFPQPLAAFSNGISFKGEASFSSAALTAALISMGAVFIISLSYRDKNTKILEEFI